MDEGGIFLAERIREQELLDMMTSKEEKEKPGKPEEGQGPTEARIKAKPGKNCSFVRSWGSL
jgi:hypothetical protein